MDMYWADTAEGFKAFYACLLALAKKEYQRRYPDGETQNSTDRKAAEETKGKGKKMIEVAMLCWPFWLAGAMLGLAGLAGWAKW